jgi:hypothetical protein
MTINDVRERLEAAWDDDGFLGKLREGNFDVAASAEFLVLLKEIRLDDNALVPKRMLSLIWYIPLFLQWQEERVANKCVDKVTYRKFVTAVVNILEEVLGVP